MSESKFAHNKVPQFFIEPSADPVVAGSREGDAPVNAWRGNQLENEPGWAGNTGNGGISQTAPYLQKQFEEAASKAGSSSSDRSSSDESSTSSSRSTEPTGTRRTGK